jgi:hypothetical protein
MMTDTKKETKCDIYRDGFKTGYRDGFIDGQRAERENMDIMADERSKKEKTGMHD